MFFLHVGYGNIAKVDRIVTAYHKDTTVYVDIHVENTFFSLCKYDFNANNSIPLQCLNISDKGHFPELHCWRGRLETL